MKKTNQTKNHSNINHKVETTFALIWKILSHYLQTYSNRSPSEPNILCSDKEKMGEGPECTSNIDLTTLDTLSSIMYKLAKAYDQMKSCEFKSGELSLKGYALKIKKKQHSPDQNTHEPRGLDPETIRLIEEQLHLL